MRETPSLKYEERPNPVRDWGDRWRPRPWAWLVILLLLMWPGSMSVLTHGNTNLWATAAVAGGLLWRWPAALLVIKPTLAPFALAGARHRSFWIALVPVAVISLVMLPIWLQYIPAMRDVRGAGLSYFLWGLPILFVPLVAYGSSRWIVK